MGNYTFQFILKLSTAAISKVYIQPKGWEIDARLHLVVQLPPRLLDVFQHQIADAVVSGDLCHLGHLLRQLLQRLQEIVGRDAQLAASQCHAKQAKGKLKAS